MLSRFCCAYLTSIYLLGCSISSIILPMFLNFVHFLTIEFQAFFTYFGYKFFITYIIYKCFLSLFYHRHYSVLDLHTRNLRISSNSASIFPVFKNLIVSLLSSNFLFAVHPPPPFGIASIVSQALFSSTPSNSSLWERTPSRRGWTLLHAVLTESWTHKATSLPEREAFSFKDIIWASLSLPTKQLNYPETPPLWFCSLKNLLDFACHRKFNLGCHCLW